jgi:hypothetical protein
MLLRKVIVRGVSILGISILGAMGLDPAVRAGMIVRRRAGKMAMRGRFDKASPMG